MRAVIGTIAMILYYLSIQYCGSGRASLYNTTYPIFVAIYSAVVFKEKLKKNNLISILLCIIGVYMVLYDGSSINLKGDLLGILSGVTGGISYAYSKRAREKDHSFNIYLWICLCGVLFSSFSAGEIISLNIRTVILLIISAAVVFAAQISITYGTKFVPVVKGSIISFLRVPLTIILSYLILHESFKLKFIAGTVLIMSGLIINRKG